MKSVGLITEYNPMHNGHIYHIKKSMELTGADVCIAVMSGNFVQRGEPAVVNKYLRAQAAIESGINLLLELPSYYALSSAEQFADGAVKTLTALNTDFLVFGSECGEISLLRSIAEILSAEPEEYRIYLKKYLSCGMTYPSARQAALTEVAKKVPDSVLSAPNNILGTEYIKAIIRQKSQIVPYTITRQGAGYNEAQISESDIFSSAAAIRGLLKSDTDENAFHKMTEKMPEIMSELIKKQYGITTPVFLDDFTALFNYRLLQIFFECGYDKNRIAERLSLYTDISTDLGNRIAVCFTGNDKLSDLILKIKSRQYTYSRISRCLIHILLEIKKEKSKSYETNLPYVRVLGFDKKGQEYLSQIKRSCPVPIITKTASFKELLCDDIYCSSVYNQVVLQKFGYAIPDEFRSGIYIKKN